MPGRTAACLHHTGWPASRPRQPHPPLLRLPQPGQSPTHPLHDLRHSTATLLLEQGVGLVVTKELLGHAHIGVTAGVYAHVCLRLRFQRQAVDTLTDVLSADGYASDAHPLSWSSADVAVKCRRGPAKTFSWTSAASSKMIYATGVRAGSKRSHSKPQKASNPCE
ncbi:tyrosine-type recombinase/integrase [Streptomyces sp. PpalLS-921]|uniref:tyrosine-type recombinase/integrase n=1 Tax=Streptomyces sp. PpalLS-921 TaxID=1839772 RepID=UPI00351ED50D